MASSDSSAIQQSIGVALGIGYRRGVSRLALERALDTALAQLASQLNRPLHVHVIATHARKTNELALAGLARARGWPLRLFDSAQLSRSLAPTPSTQVARLIGSPSVAEAAALLAGASDELLLPKHIYPDATGAAAITIAIARSRPPAP